MVVMKINKFKEYKSKNPLDTVTLIRQQLKEWGILLKEESGKCYDFHSCRLTISHKCLASYNIGTNGKGRAYDYSLASGYAEFMERFQNRLIFDTNVVRELCQVLKNYPESTLSVKAKENGISLEYVYDPKEKYQSCNEVISSLQDYGINLFSDDPNTEMEIRNFFVKKMPETSLTIVPFYSVDDEKELLLPIDLCLCATGSNGMCAGNTYKEAFLQGLCEIFERYSILNIYFKNICPPTIPINYFIGTEAEHMYNVLVSAGFKIRIIDCSLAKGLPVIGAIIVNGNNNSYNIKFGADFVPHIALERCLTEAFQSATGFNGLSSTSTWIDEVSEPNMELKYENFNKIIKNSSGVWPSTIFGDNPSYKFTPFPETFGKSDTEDVLIAKNLIKSLGFKLFIRDNTASDVPALYIFIPGMSGTYANSEHFNYNNKMYFSESFAMLDNIEGLDEASMEKLLEELKNMPLVNLTNIDLGQFAKYDQSNDMNTVDIRQLLLMLSYRLGDTKMAISLLQLLSKEKSVAKIYYTVAAKYIALRKQGHDNKEIEKILATIYPSSIISEVIVDFTNPKNSFTNYTLSKRIKNMKEDEINGLLKIMQIYMNLNESFSLKKHNQLHLRNLFA